MHHMHKSVASSASELDVVDPSVEVNEELRGLGPGLPQGALRQ